jgi:hypothetical protein
MGFNIALIWCDAKDAAALIGALGRVETQTRDKDTTAPLSGAMAGDHYLIWRNWRKFPVSAYDFDYAALSRTAPYIALDVSETTMTAQTVAYNAGKVLWSIEATGDEDQPLVTSGELPMTIDSLQRAVDAEVALSNVGQQYEVEATEFDLPVQAFVQLTGFRYDSLHDLHFFELAEIGAAPISTSLAKAKGGFFSRIFGKTPR